MTEDANADDYLERVKAEIRAEADVARQRQPLPRIDPPPFATQATVPVDGIERERLDYALSELTGAHYHAFVDQAFRTVLKRPPDEVGQAVQIKLLAAGAAKAEIIGNLRWSPEGRHIGTRVRGLLPRYLLAKASHVPLLGYAIDWAMAIAGLPLLMRHQRAADTSVTAGFDQLGTAQRQTRALLEQLQASHTENTAAHVASFAELRARLEQMSAQASGIETRIGLIDARLADAGNERAAMARELGELRHHVHVANHWVTSLQRSLDEIERDAATGPRPTAVAADNDDTAASAERTRRLASWAAQLATRLPIGAELFDLGCGDGTWLAALGAAGILASGVDSDPLQVMRARTRVRDVALGDPVATLARIADGSLAALTIDATVLVGAGDAHALLAEGRRVLIANGVLMVRIESLARAASSDVIDADVRRWTAALERAGLARMQALTDGGHAALFADRP